ncbi:hypothetical protein BG000_001028 [Podila horticola]|nr:hypothetical protein BG000_001028 [Podila horticola]
MTIPEIIRQYKADAQKDPEINLYQSNGKPTLPFSPEELEVLVKPKVLIAGGGLGGLTLAILLKKANIPFLVLERAKEVKPLGKSHQLKINEMTFVTRASNILHLNAGTASNSTIKGSAIALGSNVMPLLKQMGIYDELEQVAKPISHVHVITDEMKTVYSMVFDWLEKVTTYKTFIVPRPDLYDILWRHVPRENILLGKRILSFKQNDHGVTIRCSDNSTYDGDILVGADGAYSAVRQNLFKQLKAVEKLPASDDVTLPFSCVCLVGQTEPLDPEEFPHLKEEYCKDYSILGKDMCTWCTFTSKNNTMLWMVIQFLDKESEKKNDSFRNSEWGPEAAEFMSNEVRDCKIPGGKDGKSRTLGELIDKTPKNLMSKVMLEEKVFDTWYDGRVVLLGDACHKLVPSAGQGGVTAMHDAVTLANWIATLQAPSLSELETAFKEYRAERFPIIQDEFPSLAKTLPILKEQETARQKAALFAAATATAV